MALKQGDSVPHFELEDQSGNMFDIKKIVGKKPFVIYFYPKDFTPGCTMEACSFRDSYEDFKELGAEVIGISSDAVERHGRFAEKHNLPFVLLADLSGKVRKKFKIKAELFGLLPGRETFVFDRAGKLVMNYNNLNAASHTSKALRAVKKLNHEN